jgi:hypothetical protein
MDWRKYYKYEKKKNVKWRINSGTTCDDITFTDGETEIDFDTYIELLKREK